MNDFEKTLNNLDKFCNQKSIKYAVIGGIAVITYGYQRTTKDIDLTVLCNPEQIDKIYTEFTKEYLPIFNNSFDFFKKNFVLPVKDKTTNIKIDVAAGMTIFDEIIIKRRKRIELGNAEFFICTLEDLILYKLFAARLQDITDVQMLLSDNKDLVDKSYLLQTAEKFRELEREDIYENLEKFLSK